jgi:hypothetical protein
VLDVMLDLETMGRRPGCAIVSIGAVDFSLTEGRTGEPFYINVDLESCVEAGLTMDAGTVMWWMKQSEAARSAFTRNAYRLDEALTQFSQYLERCGPLNDIRLWGNGPSFDNAILGYAFEAASMEQPWKFWNDRCFRTISGMFPSVEKRRRGGTHHNALDDAIYQAEHLLHIRATKKKAA